MESQANCKHSADPAEHPRAGVMVTPNRSVNRQAPRGVSARKRGKLMTGSIGILVEERERGTIARVTIENAPKLNTLDSHLMAKIARRSLGEAGCRQGVCDPVTRLGL